MTKICEKNQNDLERLRDMWSETFLTFLDVIEMVERISIYMSRDGVNIEIIYWPFSCHNRLANQLDTCNNRLLLSKLEYLNRESLSIIKILS